jgi:cbb3-type cytochrome oxidase subunit 3
LLVTAVVFMFLVVIAVFAIIFRQRR